jgi:hypothetical protein
VLLLFVNAEAVNGPAATSPAVKRKVSHGDEAFVA